MHRFHKGFEVAESFSQELHKKSSQTIAWRGRKVRKY
jgi:hypothetical protein